MARNKRNVQPASSIYPPTPASERGTRTSSIFPYSVARPPTGYTSPPPGGVVPQFDMNLVSPPHPSDPFDDEEEEIPIDTRETPMYARSDWGGTTGVATAFSGSSFPRPENGGVEPLAVPSRRKVQDDNTSDAGGPKTIWSRSSFHPDENEHPLPSPQIQPLNDDNNDLYTGQAPTTAWTRSSYQVSPKPAFSPLVNQPLPPTPSRPARNPARKSVKKSTYNGGLKSAGTRHQSQLVDITEMSEESHSRSSHYGHGTPILQPDNPFSPAFATAHTHVQDDQPRSALPGYGKKHHRSTLPSILDLEHLAARPRERDTRPHSAGALDPPHIPDFDRMGAESPRLLTPEAQNKLGRMSVATARYSSPLRGNTSRSSSNSRSTNQDSTISVSSAIRSLKKPVGWLGNVKNMGVVRWYRTWRMFINAGHVLAGALLLTIALADPASGLGYLVKIQKGGLAGMPADGAFGLGVNEWCQLDKDEVCSIYTTGAFKNAEETFKVPDNPTLDILYPLWVGLTSILWLQALFLLSTSFLHFYLFFILHIPFDHLTSLPSEDEEEEGRERVEGIQREVDIRARCERPPFEEYIWVWWGWWAMRRGPVGHIYGILTGSLSVVCFGLGYQFKSELTKASTTGSVSFGMGGFLPLAVLAMVLDPFISSISYFLFHPIHSFNTFTNPPDPTPAAILLPQAEKPLARRRRATGVETFFAPPTSARFSRNQTFLKPTNPDMPSPVEIDEETKRWLDEYPKDPELVPLINDLRGGGVNDDFILSEVGLLYLRPDDQDPNGAALLVPPNGVIRREVLEDAHVDEEGKHLGYLAMTSQLGEVFWWVGMEQDIELEIGKCKVCHGQGQSHQQRVRGGDQTARETEMYTGVTAWTGVDEDEKRENALAADMAIAMRRADEEAKKQWEA